MCRFQVLWVNYALPARFCRCSVDKPVYSRHRRLANLFEGPGKAMNTIAGTFSINAPSSLSLPRVASSAGFQDGMPRLARDICAARKFGSPNTLPPFRMAAEPATSSLLTHSNGRSYLPFFNEVGGRVSPMP